MKKKPIRQRTKKERLAIDGVIGDGIELTLRASPQDWERLYDYFKSNDVAFLERFRDTFLIPAFIKMFARRISPRNTFSSKMKLQAALLSRAFRQDKDSWNPFIREITKQTELRELLGTGFQDFHVLCSAYCMQQFYGDEISKHKLNPFFPADKDVYENFVTTYIKDGINILREAKDILLQLASLVSLSKDILKANNQEIPLIADFIILVNIKYFESHLNKCNGCLHEMFNLPNQTDEQRKILRSCMEHYESAMILAGMDTKYIVDTFTAFLS